MDWTTFAVEMTKALAWPALVLAAGLRFHRHVSLGLFVAIKTIRRMRRVKFGDLEMAAEVVEAAADASEEKVRQVEEKITAPNLDIAERQVLAEQLKSAVAEAQHLRAVLAAVKPVQSRAMSVLSAQRANYERKADSLLSSMLPFIEPYLLADRKDPFPLIARVGEIVNSARIGNTPIVPLTQGDIDLLENMGLIEASGMATIGGAQVLMRLWHNKKKKTSPAAN